MQKMIMAAIIASALGLGGAGDGRGSAWAKVLPMSGVTGGYSQQVAMMAPAPVTYIRVSFGDSGTKRLTSQPRFGF